MKITYPTKKYLKWSTDNIGVLCFWVIILFQTTVLKYIWSIENISYLVNLLMLLFFLLMGVVSVFKFNFSSKVWWLYLLPCLFVLFFQNINIFRNVFYNYKLISYFGLTLPWATILVIPILMKLGTINLNKIWKHFYYFIVISIVISSIEYFLVLNGKYIPRMLEIPNGIFLSGRFTFFHMLQDGTAHERFYGCFSEPGDLAMYLLLAIAYAFFHKKYISLGIFLMALYFTQSLGGFIGLTLMIIIFPLFFKDTKSKLYGIFIFAMIGLVVGVNLSKYFSEKYEEKGGSRETREENFSKTLLNLPIATVTYPIGMELKETTSANEENKLYFGSNFTLGFAFVLGGIGAFLGYIFFMLVSLSIATKSFFCNNLSLIDKIVCSSLIVMVTFVVQRISVWDSALFGFLFSPYILNKIDCRYLIK